jgi:hypothetical protein
MIAALFIIASAIWMHKDIEFCDDLKLIISAVCFSIGLGCGVYEISHFIYALAIS